MTQDKRRKKAVRERMAETGETYTEAARHVAGAPAETPAAAVDRFGGHEFEYERDTDLFRCTECEVYEVVAEGDDGTFAPCPGLPGWDGDPERVYLLLTENPAVYNASWHVTRAAREHRIGRGARFGYRDGRLLVETAPAVVDQLHRILAALTEPPSSATSLPKAGAERVAVATAIERLTFEQGQAVIAANYAAYVAEYGEPDAPVDGRHRVVVHHLVLPEREGDVDVDAGDYEDEYGEYGDSSGYFDDNPELDDYYD